MSAIPINGMTLKKELRDKQMTGVGQEGDPMFSVRADGGQHAVAFSGDIARTLQARHDSSPCADRGMDVVAQHALGFNWQNGGGYGEANDGLGITLEGVGPLQRCQTPAVANGGGMAVRRLTPKECERLQGFPDNHTLIPWRGKPAEQCPDGPRYKALGNSMAVPCMAWIGSRIAAQDSEPLRYLSVCSGIEAASMAWEPLGWQPAAFAEVEKFPSAVLAHHWPQVPNMGDMNNHEQWDLPSIDVLVGGTPCQSFSVAGLRKGLRDPRGGLMLTFLEIAQRRRPRWIVWENVPGVLSSNGGRDFGSFLGALGSLGYGWAYRVLDAQWFGVAQRRRRVFVIANLGDGAAPAKVLFESESVRRNPAPSREAGERTAADAAGGVGDGRRGGSDVTGAIDCRIGAQRAQNAQAGHYVPAEKPVGALTANMVGCAGTPGYNETEHILPITVGALTDGAHQGGGLTAKMPTRAAYSPALANPLTARMGKGINTTLDEGQTAIVCGKEPTK